MINSFRKRGIAFLGETKDYPIITAIASGLYPLIYYYDKNFTLVNSWSQLTFFILSFLIIPILIFWFIHKMFHKIRGLNNYIRYVLPILNLCLFAFFIIICTYGYKKKILALGLFLAFLFAIFLVKHFKKIIIFQLILSVLVLAKLTPDFYRHLTYSSSWMQQSDAIEQVQFIKKPNIYIIQPDGYANFSELKKGNYDYDNSAFENFLTQNDFKLYQNFRSNYFSTLSSNSSMFAMKHHYYNTPKAGMNELYNSRDIIVGKNPVTNILKNNNYKTFLMLEKSYLLLNRPKMFYDYCNIDYGEIPYLARGFEIEKDLKKDLEQAIINNKATSNFYFIEKITPSHIAPYKKYSRGIDIEGQAYLNELRQANRWLQEVITMIDQHDKNALIVVVADHGGFVGMNYTMECKEKQTDRDLVYSIFTAALAIKWPDKAPVYDKKIKTSVNLFRILFSYLSSDDSYLDKLQEDESFTIIEKGAPFGVYEIIDNNGNVVFDKFFN